MALLLNSTLLATPKHPVIALRLPTATNAKRTRKSRRRRDVCFCKLTCFNPHLTCFNGGLGTSCSYTTYKRHMALENAENASDDSSSCAHNSPNSQGIPSKTPSHDSDDTNGYDADIGQPSAEPCSSEADTVESSSSSGIDKGLSDASPSESDDKDGYPARVPIS